VNAEDKTNATGSGTIQKLTRLLAAPTIEPSQRAARIQAVEKDIVLPLRALIIVIVAYYFFFAGWFYTAGSARLASFDTARPRAATIQARTNQTNFAQPADRGRAHAAAIKTKTGLTNFNPSEEEWSLRHAATIKTGFLAYVAFNAFAGIILVWVPQLTLKKIETIVFSIGVLDALLMGTLTLDTNGFDSILYWVFLVLILHNALAIPVALPQLLLNFFVSAAFMAGGLVDKKIIVPLDRELFGDDAAARFENSVVVERLIVLVAWTLCCYGIQVLFEKQKRAEAEATEFAVRQERLQTAGRLAAEIAHQIKNPLGIITNAAFCLQRAVRERETAAEEQSQNIDEQVQIIREEIEHADQIITELMGYAQLAEGTVERLEAANEVDNAILEVFPPAAKYRVEIVKIYEPSLPALLMQKRHLSGVLVNLLQNAREAMNGVGRIEVSVRYGKNDSVIISIADNGPGIAPDKINKIFEAHFSTRAKGTGLGLAIVKHNTEIYGGTVNVQSELGKGTRFTLEFPARILMRLSK
jgi:signal transduction histidine kinase